MTIKGIHFRQKNLPNAFENKTLGQQLITKFLLLIFILIIVFIAGFISGLFGALSGLYIIVGTDARLEFILAVLVVCIWLLSTVYQSLSKNILVVTTSIFFAILIQELVGRLYLSIFTNLSWLVTFVSIMYVLIFTAISFFTIRFSIALFSILFPARSNITIIAIFFIICCAAIVGSCAEIFLEINEPESNYRGALLASTNLKIVTIFFGVTFNSVVTWSAMVANRFHCTPWSYPSLLRSWALAVGSWRGTSFYNLDLSSVNFTGAKLTNTDLRAKKLYRTCFQGVIGLERARVDNCYLDLAYPKVQKLLTHKSSLDPNFCKFNLQGAYLQGADMRGFNLTDTNLTGADLKGADLRGSILIRTQLAGADFQGVDLRQNILIDANLTEADLRKADLRDCILVRAQVARADFSGADLTGICIEDWSVSSKTSFTDVRCDYIYRRYQDQQPTDRYPFDRNFEPGEFASQFQQPENQLELVFKGEFDYTALSLTFEQLQTDKPDLNLKLQGIEQRDNLWVVKITSDNPATVETRIKEIQDVVYQGYEVTTTRLENNPLIRRIISDVANIRKTQAETTEEIERLAQRIGSNFYFLGGTITNVTGAGEIQYTEASNQIRNLVTSGRDETQTANTLLTKLASSNVATTANEQTELVQFVILEEVKRDPQFKQFLLQQGQQILDTMPNNAIASAIHAAIAQLG